MKTKLAILGGLAALALGAGSASAGGSEGSVGVGAEEIFNVNLAGTTFSIGGLSANYDMGQFHVGGVLGFFDDGGNDDTDVFIGGRFYYHLHSTAMSDFSVGASATMGFLGDGNPGSDNSTVMLLEPGFQIRAFVASNVALSFSGGLTLGLLDADGVSIGGQGTGSAGVHYYFF
ncbi:MAG TPA: hypothetical protein VM261_11545 [Kofleriaceae bacterium]|nr:hypothetical protein [Kofleriaceae bacterium]